VNEFNKWLGPGQVNAIPFGDSSNKKKAKEAMARWQFTHDPSEFVLVASYDQMRINISEIAKVEDLGTQNNSKKNNIFFKPFGYRFDCL